MAIKKPSRIPAQGRFNRGTTLLMRVLPRTALCLFPILWDEGFL